MHKGDYNWHAEVINLDYKTSDYGMWCTLDGKRQISTYLWVSIWTARTYHLFILRKIYVWNRLLTHSCRSILKRRLQNSLTWLRLAERQLDKRRFMTSRWWFFALRRPIVRFSCPILPFANLSFLTTSCSRLTSAAYTFLSTSSSCTSSKCEQFTNFYTPRYKCRMLAGFDIFQSSGTHTIPRVRQSISSNHEHVTLLREIKVWGYTSVTEADISS